MKTKLPIIIVLNWYGIPHIGFYFKSDTQSPKILYKGEWFNTEEVEDAMYNDYKDAGDSRKMEIAPQIMHGDMDNFDYVDDYEDMSPNYNEDIY